MSTLGLLPTLVADCDVAVSAILESTHTSETTPTQGSHETQNIVTFTSSGLTTPARLYQKYMDPVAASMPSQQPLIPAPTPQNLNTFSGLPPLPQHGYSHCDPHQNSCVDSPSPLNTRLMSDASHEHSVGAHSALMARPPPLLHENTNIGVLSSLFCSPQPQTECVLATPRAFGDTSNLTGTPSDIFGKFDPLAATNTPFAHLYKTPNAPASSPRPAKKDFLNNAIPLTFSAANTPIAPPSESRMPDKRECGAVVSVGEGGIPNPAAIASFFRQRSAHLSSPIFRHTARAASANLAYKPLVRVNPLADSDVAAAALPPSITPLHVADINFSLTSGFSKVSSGVDLDLGLRAARVPIPYAIRLRFVDIDGPIRPIAARLERLLGGPQSMFTCVIDTNSHSCPKSPASSVHVPLDDSCLPEGMTCAFWAAPDALLSTGCGSLMLTVTDDEYRDHEVSIDISVRSTKPCLTIDAPGYFPRSVRSETSVSFSRPDDDTLITVWNETDGDAPLLLNIVLHEDSGGAFLIGDETIQFSECIPILLRAGCSHSFWTRFTQRPDMTVRHCYYGTVLIKYALAVQARTPPGHDLELHQYYDHVLNLKAALGANETTHELTEKPRSNNSCHQTLCNSDTSRPGSECGCIASPHSPTNPKCKDVEEKSRKTVLEPSLRDHGDLHSCSHEDSAAFKAEGDLFDSVSPPAKPFSDLQELEKADLKMRSLSVKKKQLDHDACEIESNSSAIVIRDKVTDVVHDDTSNNSRKSARLAMYPMKPSNANCDGFCDVQGQAGDKMLYASAEGLNRYGNHFDPVLKTAACTAALGEKGEFDFLSTGESSMRPESENSETSKEKDVDIDDYSPCDSQHRGMLSSKYTTVVEPFECVHEPRNAVPDDDIILPSSVLNRDSRMGVLHTSEEDRNFESEMPNVNNEPVQHKNDGDNEEDAIDSVFYEHREQSVQCNKTVSPDRCKVDLRSDSRPLHSEIPARNKSETNEICQDKSFDHMALETNKVLKSSESRDDVVEEDLRVYPIDDNHTHGKAEPLQDCVSVHGQGVNAKQKSSLLRRTSTRASESYAPIEDSCNASLKFIQYQSVHEAAEASSSPHANMRCSNSEKQECLVQTNEQSCWEMHIAQDEKAFPSSSDDCSNFAPENKHGPDETETAGQQNSAFNKQNQLSRHEGSLYPNQCCTPEETERRFSVSREQMIVHQDATSAREKKPRRVEQNSLVRYDDISLSPLDRKLLETQLFASMDEKVEAEEHIAGIEDSELRFEADHSSGHQLLDMHRIGDHESSKYDPSIYDLDSNCKGKYLSKVGGPDVSISFENTLIAANDSNDHSIAAEALASLRYATQRYSVHSQSAGEKEHLVCRELPPEKDMTTIDNQRNVGVHTAHTEVLCKTQEDVGAQSHSLTLNLDKSSGDAHAETAQTRSQHASTNLSSKRPKLKMPRYVREGGVVLNANQGYAELPVLNASAEVVEITVTVECMRKGQGDKVTTTVTPNYIVIGAGEQARLTMMRTSSASAESLVVLRASTMGSNPVRMNYRIPAHISKSVMRVEACSEFAVDRPTMSFYNPSEKFREWRVRLRNGTSQTAPYRVWIGEGCGNLHNSNGDPAFRIIGPDRGIVNSGEHVIIRVCFEGGESVGLFHGRLNMLVGGQRDFMPLFGYSGTSNVRLYTNELGYVCARNEGNRFGFIVITGPESDSSQNSNVKAVLAPGEEREFVAPYGSGSVIYTGDEIARSRERRAGELRCLGEEDSYGSDDGCELFRGEFEGEDMAHEVESLDWWAEDKFSIFYSGRLLDHNTKRYVFSLKDGETAILVQTDSPSRHGWTATVTDGFVHIENLEAEQEIYFEIDGAEPKCGVIAPLGNAMLAAFRENVEVRALGRIETLHVELPKHI